MTPTNSLKSRLQQGETLRGIWLALAHGAVAEIAGHAGFDWCLLDGEHGPNTLTTLADQLRTLAGTPAAAAVRVPVNEAWVIKQVLDLGAQTILIPMVHDGADAARAVAACRYPPQGLRGVGAALARASGFGANAAYIHEADRELCIMVQAESRASVENIDAIATTEGVDVVFIGPADLAADLGHPGEMEHPEVTEAIDHLLARIAAAGKVAGTVVFGRDSAAQMAEKGVRFLGVGGDAVLLRDAMAALARP